MLAILLNPWARAIMFGVALFSFGLLKGWDWGSAAGRAIEQRIAAETKVAQAQNAAANTAIESEGAIEAAQLLARNAELDERETATAKIIAQHEGEAKCEVSIDTIRALNASR